MKKRGIILVILFFLFNGSLLYGQFQKTVLTPVSGFAIKINSRGELESSKVVLLTQKRLTQKAIQAIELSPEWLKADLEINFRYMSTGAQDRWGEVIINTEKRFRDEISFLIAHLPPKLLESSIPTVAIQENINYIYIMAERLPYVEIVEVEENENNWFTTLRYKVSRNGVIQDWELPYTYYYWYVVSPIIDAEKFSTYNPTYYDREAPPPEGITWRKYYIEDKREPITASYRLPYMLKYPNLISQEYIDNINWGDIRVAYSTVDVERSEVSGISIIRESSSKGAVLFSFVYGDNRCCDQNYPAPDGEIIINLIPVELLFNRGYRELLENLVLSGAGNGAYINRIAIGNSNGLPIFQDAKVLIVRDRIPFGLSEDPIETILQNNGVNYDVISSEELLNIILFTTEPPYHPVEYGKIIIPSDQPKVLYERLSEYSQELETYVDYGGILEIHGFVTHQEDDWSNLRLPGGVYIREPFSPNEPITVEVGGFPSLPESIEGVEGVWDGESYPNLAGTRPLNPEEGALGVIGWWVEKNLPRNISEAWFFYSGNIERSTQPVRVLFNHYGNCGEIQDVLGAASRTLLIPTRAVSTLADDHVWNEFFLLDRWHPYQVSWSGSATHIDNWSISYDGDTGGSKTVAAVIGWEMNGEIVNLLGRYTPVEIDEAGHISGDYSRYATLHFKVTDKKGAPVDGALVLLATEWYYDENQLTLATWGYTDPNGELYINVGENNNFYAYVTREDIGSYPESEHGEISVVRVATKFETTAGAVKDIMIRIDGEITPLITDLGKLEVIQSEPKIIVNLTTDVEKTFQPVVSVIEEDGVVIRDSIKATFYLYVMDEENFSRWERGLFANGHKYEFNEDQNLEVILPERDWYLVISRADLFSTGFVASLKINDIRKVEGTISEDVEIEDGGLADIPISEREVVPEEEERLEVQGGGCNCNINITSNEEFSLLFLKYILYSFMK